MAGEKTQPEKAQPFDLAQLKQLFELMESHGLTEVNLRHGEEHWRLRRGPQQVAAPQFAYAPPPPAPIAPAPAPVAAPQSAAAAVPVAAPAAADSGLVIKSEAVGTFYTRPTPEDKSFVTVGQKVAPDTIVCLIEAMKVFNQIPAGVTGEITAILVKDGDAVEFGTPLFKYKP